MDNLRDIYKRFKKNYRTENGGINLYPQFDYDLNKLMQFLDNTLDTRGGYVDCTWRPPLGEDD